MVETGPRYQLYVGVDVAADTFTAAWLPPGGTPTAVGAQNPAGNQAARSWRCSRPAATVRTRIGPMVRRTADR